MRTLDLVADSPHMTEAFVHVFSVAAGLATVEQVYEATYPGALGMTQAMLGNVVVLFLLLLFFWPFCVLDGRLDRLPCPSPRRVSVAPRASQCCFVLSHNRNLLHPA